MDIFDFTALFAHMGNLDLYLEGLLATAGMWAYLLLFAVIFCETGLVFTAFLPGDTLFFLAATLAASGHFNLPLLFLLGVSAALLGDVFNYWVGTHLGPRAFSGRIRLLQPGHLRRTSAFFDRHGGKAIVAARFIPLLRTLAPFVAGMGAMPFPRFLRYTLISVGVWFIRFGIAGYFFGGLAVVQENFWLTLIVVILLPLFSVSGRLLRRGLPTLAGRTLASEFGD